MELRLGEALSLRVSGIDAERMKAHIRQAKGKQDRYVILPQLSLEALRRYWLTHRNPKLLFPRGHTLEERQKAEIFMDRGGLQRFFRAIAKDAGIHKAITLHSLRYCYSLLLIDERVGLRAI